MSAISDIKSYFKQSLGEIYFAVWHIAFLLFVAGLIVIPASAMPFGGAWQWYRITVYWIIGGTLNICVVQLIVRRYEELDIQGNSIALGVCWCFLCSLLGTLLFSLFAHLLSSERFILLPSRAFYQNLKLYSAAIFMTAVISSLILTPVMFSPVLILKRQRDFLRQSCTIAKTSFVALFLIQFGFTISISALNHFIGLVIESGMLKSRDVASVVQGKYLYVFTNLEMHAIGAVLGGAILSSAYLQITKRYVADFTARET